MRSLRFLLPFGGRAKISGDVVAIVDRYRQHGPADAEAGGALLGRLILDSLDVVVDEVTEPGPGDVRSRLGFDMRDLAHHQAHIDASWARSEGTCSVLGHWHTHPEPDPTPSRVDLDDWRRRLREDAGGVLPRLLFVIVGTKRIRAWQGDRTSMEICEAAAVPDASAAVDPLAPTLPPPPPDPRAHPAQVFTPRFALVEPSADAPTSTPSETP